MDDDVDVIKHKDNAGGGGAAGGAGIETKEGEGGIETKEGGGGIKKNKKDTSKKGQTSSLLQVAQPNEKH
jgi:hypothetical protein